MGRFGAVRDASAVLARRSINRLAGPRGRRELSSWNTMFKRRMVERLRAEKQELEAFDLTLYSKLNDPRLVGQIVFEYGVLTNYLTDWKGKKILDIGSGGSSFPRWMGHRGASVASFDYPDPIERPGGGKRATLNRWVQPDLAEAPMKVGGDMLVLPFRDESFDLVCSLSVIEHLDTELPGRSYVAYAEQKRRAACALDEMVRVARRGGLIYVTSDCCDYERATVDHWRESYYFRPETRAGNNQHFSGAWPVEDVPELFYRYLSERGCRLVGECDFRPRDLDGSVDSSTFRGPFFSAFSVLVERIR